MVLTHSCLCPPSCRGCHSHRMRPMPWTWWSSLLSTAWASSPRTSSSMPGPSAASLVPASLLPTLYAHSAPPPSRGVAQAWDGGLRKERARAGLEEGILCTYMSHFLPHLHLVFKSRPEPGLGRSGRQKLPIDCLQCAFLVSLHPLQTVPTRDKRAKENPGAKLVGRVRSTYRLIRGGWGGERESLSPYPSSPSWY